MLDPVVRAGKIIPQTSCTRALSIALCVQISNVSIVTHDLEDRYLSAQEATVGARLPRPGSLLGQLDIRGESVGVSLIQAFATGFIGQCRGRHDDLGTSASLVKMGDGSISTESSGMSEVGVSASPSI